ncbi:MAG TPA: hypothetical protein VN428_02575 [Bryobacteraceae bacterium]|nr:hypothetical protein [Bryobacteraceae bacterium]
MLTASGFCVFEAASLREAALFCRGRQDRIDLVIVNDVAVDAGGPEVISQIIRQHPEAKEMRYPGSEREYSIEEGIPVAAEPDADEHLRADDVLDQVRRALGWTPGEHTSQRSGGGA